VRRDAKFIANIYFCLLSFTAGALLDLVPGHENLDDGRNKIAKGNHRLAIDLRPRVRDSVLWV